MVLIKGGRDSNGAKEECRSSIAAHFASVVNAAC